jgi:hypothetical protein
MRLADRDINWHDGNLVDIRVNGLPGDCQELDLVVDLYAETEKRRRFRCVGSGLRRILISGDMKQLTKNRVSGNVDFMRMDFTADTELLVVSLFGGTIEAEATEFQLTEV